MEPFPEVSPVPADLDGASKKNEMGKCKHFSMRKYVSEMRQKDAGKGWPFKLDCILSEVPKEVLPSLDVPEYRWWKCRYCLPEFWATVSDKENGAVKDASCIKCKLGGSVANVGILGETAMPASNCQLTLNLDMAVAEKSNFKISAEISADRCNAPVLSVANRRDGTLHNRSKIIEDVDGKYVEGEMDATPGSNIKESPALCCNGNGNLATENDEKTMEADKQAIDGKVTEECEHEKVGLLDRFVCHGKEPAPDELDERDSPSSDSTAVGPHKSGSLRRRKYRKVRRLTDLLASVEDTSNSHIRKENAPLLTMCDASLELRKQAGEEGEMADFGNAKKVVLKKKRKLTSKDSMKSLKHVRKDQEKDNPLVLTGTAKNGNVDLDSQTDDNELPEMFSRSSLKGNLPEHVNEAMSKKKKKIQVIGHSSEKKAISSEIKHTSTSANDNEFPNGALGTTLSPSHGTSKNISFFKEKNNLPPMQPDQIPALPPDPSSCSGHPFASTNKNVRENLLASAQYWSEKPSSAVNGTHLSSKAGSNVATGFDKFVISQMMRGPSFHGMEDVFRDGNTAKNNSESSTMHVDPRFPSRHVSNAFRSNGVNGIIADGNDNRIPFLCEIQRYSPNMVDQPCFLTPNSGISGASKKKKANKHREYTAVEQRCRKKSVDQGNPDDIPMEIVELMAKHQYERCQQDAEMDKIPISRAKKVWGSEVTKISKEDGRRKQNSWLNDSFQKREFHPQNGHTVLASKDIRSSAQKSFDMSSDVSANGYNLNQMERYHMPPVHHTLFNDQGIHNFPPIGSSSNLGNTRCNGMNENFSRNKVLDGNFLSLGVSGIWYAPKHSEELGPRNSSMRPDSIPFVYSIMPQSCDLHSNSINFQPHCPGTPPKVEMNCTRDPRLSISRASGFHKSEKDLNFEVHRGSNLQNPLISRLNAVEHEEHMVAPLDISSNEAIPAMHLLSLMDAGMHSGKKMKLDENARITEQPSMPRQSRAKEVCSLHLGLCKTCVPLRHPSFDYDHQAQVFPGKYQELSVVPAFGLSASANQPANIFMSGSVGKPRVPPNVNDKGKGKCYEAGTSGVAPFLSGNVGLGTSYGFKPYHNMERNFPNSSKTRVLSPYQRMSEIQTIEARNDIRTATQPRRNNPDGAICTVNRNPAEFSVPEEGNVYSIGRDDLKLVKRVRNKRELSKAHCCGGKKMAKPEHFAGTSQNQLQMA